MSNKVFLIGINKYKYQQDLASCVKDTNDFRSALVDKFQFLSSDIYELKDENATSKKIQDALRGYARSLGSEDNLVIYFSGHGEYEEDFDRGYWVPYEAEDYTQFIANTTLLELLGAIKCKHLFLISDSCFSNAIFRVGKTKKLSEYFDKRSRWALSSAFHEAKDADPESNTLFAEAIIDSLLEATTDIRVSELVEKVKNRFSVNEFQAPQGAPLSLSEHHGGEFVFKIEEHHDTRKLKGYVDFKKILQFYKRNSVFNEVATYEDKSLRVGYQLFKETDSVIKSNTYYLYLYEGINQVQTISNLNSKHPEIFNKNTVIFIPIEKNQKSIERRKNNIEEKFNPLSLFYIDEFIREHCTPTVIQDDDDKYLNINNFILPKVNLGDKKVNIDGYFKDWYDEVNNPILVIKGGGGIGKTTLAYYFADKLMKVTPSNYVLFIDSILIKDSLLKNKNRGSLSLYNFYEALFDITDNIHDKLSAELFYLNIDAGNILIIIDGLDEIISKIPDFDTEDFLNSISRSSNELANGKVIITCRTFFWDEENYGNDHFFTLALEPFNENQSKEFFRKSFGEDTKKIEQSNKLAAGFRFPTSGDENIYHPYVLDIIRSIVDSDADVKNIELGELDPGYLSKNINNDYITFRVCDRESKRVGQIPVDEQIKFFIYLAVGKRGVIKSEDFHHELCSSLDKNIDRTLSSAFKAHPFLTFYDEIITFKYDFLSDLFKSIYVYRRFNFEVGVEVIDDGFINVMSESCWYGSPMCADISKRVDNWNEDSILLISDYIEQLKIKDIPNRKANKAISNLFNLALTINHRYFPNDVLHNTNIMKKLFESKVGILSNVKIIDLNFEAVKFDFSGLEVSDSLIDNYGSFWMCGFNDETRFIRTELLNLNSKIKNSVLGDDNFIDCIFDSYLTSILERINSSKKSKSKNLRSFIHDFFHLFVSNGRLGRQWEHKVIAPRFNSINELNLSYKKVIDVFKKSEVLVITEEIGKKKFAIHEKHKGEVNSFLKDGTISDPIAKILGDLSQII